jgi:hypothetical protein
MAARKEVGRVQDEQRRRGPVATEASARSSMSAPPWQCSAPSERRAAVGVDDLEASRS